MKARHDGAAPKGTMLLVGNYRPTLPVARSLAEAGYRVVLTHDDFPAAERSRYVDEVWRPKAHSTNTAPFLNELERYLAARGEIGGVYPVSQALTTKLLANRDRIRVPVIAGTPEAVMTCVDKVRTSGLAAELGVPIARFATGSDAEDIVVQANRLGYPCIAKRNDGYEHSTKAIVFRNERELRLTMERWPDWFGNVMLQQFAWGPRYNRYFIAHGGRILRFVDVKILRTDRIDDTGLAVTGISVAPVAALDEPSNRLIESLGFSGVGCVQFLIDELRGTISFLEINARIPGNYAFAHYCGLDQATALVEVMQDRRLDHWGAAFSYPVGKRYAWLLGDLYGLVQGVELRQVSGSQAIGWLFKALASGARAHNHIIWSRDDPKPALYLGCRAVWPLSRRAARQSARILVQRAKSLTGRSARVAG